MLSSFPQKMQQSQFFKEGKRQIFNDVERDVLNVIYWEDKVTQSLIVERTHIPQQTVSRALKSLQERGVIELTNIKVNAQRGKPGLVLRVLPDFAYSIGLGILEEGMELTVLDFNGQIKASRFIEMNMHQPGILPQRVMQEFQMLSKEYQIPPERVLGLGIGISGYFIGEDRQLNTVLALDEWAKIDISELFCQQTGWMTWQENDATAAASGESMTGAGRYATDFVYLFISDKFGGGLVSHNQLIRGAHGNAGELGDMLPPKLYIHPNLEVLKMELARHGNEVSQIDLWRSDFDCNQPGVKEWLFKIKDSVNLVCSCCSALLDSQSIIVGGHIPKPLAKMLAAQTEIYVQKRRQSQRPGAELIVSTVPKHPVSVGAASIPIRELCLHF